MKKRIISTFCAGLLLTVTGISAGAASVQDNAAYSPIPFGAPIVFAGDSIVAHGFQTTATDARTMVRAFGVWALILAKQPFALIPHSNAGVGGNTSTQLLNRYDADVIAYKPKVVVILIGTNDLGGIIPADTTISNIATMLARNKDIGAFTFLLKILPRGNAAIKSRQLGPPMLRDWNKINDWIATQNSRNVCVVDCEPTFGNMDPAHTAKQGLTADDLHPNQLGAYTIGTTLLQAFSKVMTPGEILFTANNDPANYVSNGFMTGTDGTVISATGQMATSWSGSGAAAGGATVAFSKVARTDGYGDWQQMTVSGTSTGNSKCARIFRAINLTGLFKPGDVVQMACEIEVDAGSTGIAAFNASAQSTGVNLTVNNRVSHTRLSGEPVTIDAWRGVYRSVPFVLSSGLGITTFEMDTFFLDTETTAPVKATVRYGRCQFIKLPKQD